MSWETLYPLPSVFAFINEDLKIYRMDEHGQPDISQWNFLGNVASKWVNQISDRDDDVVSELIYNTENQYDYTYGV